MDRLRLWFIGTIPFLRSRYLASLRWKLQGSAVEFNKPIPPRLLGTFGYARTVMGNESVNMSVYIAGKKIAEQ